MFDNSKKPTVLSFLFKNRFVIFTLYLILFVTIHYIFFGSLLPTTETRDFWFYSGMFMMLFSILFIDPYYTSPKNVITNVIPLLLVFLPIRSFFDNQFIWWFSVGLFLILLLISISAMALKDKNKSEDSFQNKLASLFKNIAVVLGRGKILYSFVFLYFFLLQYSINDSFSLFMLMIWISMININPKFIHNNFFLKNNVKDSDKIGEIFSVDSEKMFLIKLFEDKKDVDKFDLVRFRYSMYKDDSQSEGIIFNTYFLNQEKWAKVLQLSKSDVHSKLSKNAVYKISEQGEGEAAFERMRVSRFVGVIASGSVIGKIKFEYSKKTNDIQEGDLLELKVGGKRIFYQIINGVTATEKLEDRNKSSYIIGEATQLGEWQVSELSFQKFGWMPEVNTPIFKADTSNINIGSFSYPYYKLGFIPGTSLPSVINLDDAVSHHMALIGITGAGKSFLAHKIIDEIKVDTKVICVDFNKEFVTSLSPAPSNIIEDLIAEEIAQRIDWINKELGEFPNNRNRPLMSQKENEIKELIGEEIDKFLDNDVFNISVFELPDVSNTVGIFDYTKYFFKTLFEIVKVRKNQGNPVKICVVLEEAHTVVPEWKFSGSSDKASQALVNSIGQVTLQGRKYGVGFLVITQRTANVSKTVLTQCNTVVCFQAFDETSFSFLGNYVGGEMVRTLPNLKKYHAVVSGKAIKSNMPMIIDLERE